MTNGMAGAGKAEIRISEGMLPYDGFTAIHDPVYVRSVLFLVDGTYTVVSVVDATSLLQPIIDKLKAVIGDRFSVEKSNIWISASHSFNVPHISPKAGDEKSELMYQATREALIESIDKALINLQETYISCNVTKSCVNVNRDIYTVKGWWLGRNEQGDSDKTVTTIRLDNKDGDPIAYFINYAVQSSVMHTSKMKDGQYMVSSDLFGKVSEKIEERVPGCVAMCLCGAAADQAPVQKANSLHLKPDGSFVMQDIGEAGYVIVDLLGEQLAEAVLQGKKEKEKQALTSLEVICSEITCDGQEIPQNTLGIEPVVTYQYKKAESQIVPIMMIRLQDIWMIGVQPELSNCNAEKLRKRLKSHRILLCTMVNGAAKYMVNKEYYDEYRYEAINSMFARGSAEILMMHIEDKISLNNSRTMLVGNWNYKQCKKGIF